MAICQPFKKADLLNIDEYIKKSNVICDSLVAVKKAVAKVNKHFQLIGTWSVQKLRDFKVANCHGMRVLRSKPMRHLNNF